MTITKFAFRDNYRHWELKPTTFSNFNLLVGLSGAGKTRTLQALRSVCEAVLDYNTEGSPNGCTWTLEMLIDGQIYHWQAETSLVKSVDYDYERPGYENPIFIYEQLDTDRRPVFERIHDEIVFRGNSLPNLKNTESIVSIFRNDAQIQPFYNGLRRVIFADYDETVLTFFFKEQLRELNNYSTLEQLRLANNFMLTTKAYMLQEKHPKHFSQLVDDYIDIFNTVADVRVGTLDRLERLPRLDNVVKVNVTKNRFQLFNRDVSDTLSLLIKEKNINDWTPQPYISTGMYRVMMHLLEIYLAPPGTVIVVDEFETSLGVNCLPAITERFWERAHELQFILTSHHPYVINNIAVDRWKIVTRKGSTVTILDKDDIPALNTNSAQEKFTLLMNLHEYEEGIQ